MATQPRVLCELHNATHCAAPAVAWLKSTGKGRATTVAIGFDLASTRTRGAHLLCQLDLARVVTQVAHECQSAPPAEG